MTKYQNIVYPQNPAYPFLMSPLSVEEIPALIDSLTKKKKKTIRKLDVETKFLEFGKVLISYTRSNSFHKFIEEGIHPSCPKTAEVIPVFKKGNWYIATNCSPISLLRQLDKLFEKLMYNKIYS